MPNNGDNPDQPFAGGRSTTNETDPEPQATNSSTRPQATDQPTASTQSKIDGQTRSDDRNRADRREIKERLRAVERALTGGEASVSDITTGATAAAEREAIESRLDDLESRVEELEAATQAIRGYVGSVRAVNREVERRADLALARASDNGGKAELNQHDVSSDGSTQRDDAIPTDESIEDVPSDSALNAALPQDRHHGEAAAGSTSDGVDRDVLDQADDNDGSWRDEALDRLRESL